VPAAKYNVIHDWSKPEMFASTVGKLRGRFQPEGKGIKMFRMSEQIMYDEVKKHVPAGKYKIQQYFGTGPKYPEKCDKLVKMCAFIEDSNYLSK
jgi:hypothetical protein